MTKVKIGTFNIENLFMRYKLLDNVRGDRSGTPINYDAFTQGGHINMLGWSIEDYGPISKSARRLTAKVISENEPDVLAVQEVENLEALIQFNRTYLGNTYHYMMVIDGNDPRQIDVGVLSRFDFEAIRTHRFEPPDNPPWSRTFSRDCLEVELCVTQEKRLIVLINHFKSKIGGGEDRRREQANRVTEILKGRFGDPLRGDFVVAGDLNNAPDAPEFRSLMGLGLENVVESRLPEEERWTHYYKRGRLAEQLDYLLLSPELGTNNPDAVPYIERRGLGADIDHYQGQRFDANVTGADGASDHCPVFIEVDV